MSPLTDGRDAVTVITGAAGGIGAAVAARVGASGGRLLLVDRDAAALEAVARQSDRAVDGVDGDLRDPACIERVVTAVGEGGCVGLVHVAGIGPVQTDDPLEILDVNLRCVDALTRALRPAFVPAASVVTVGSVASRRAPADADELLARPDSQTWAEDWIERRVDSWAAYAYSKRGVRLHAMAAAVAWALDGVRINVVSPSQTATALGLESFESDEAIRAFVERIPMRRMATPEEVAGAIAYLLGPDASFVTGIELFVDGGAGAAGSAMQRDAAVVGR